VSNVNIFLFYPAVSFTSSAFSSSHSPERNLQTLGKLVYFSVRIVIELFRFSFKISLPN